MNDERKKGKVERKEAKERGNERGKEERKGEMQGREGKPAHGRIVLP